MSSVTSVSDTTLKWAEQRSVPIQFAQQTGSTNDDSKKRAMNEEHDLVLYVSAHQTAGRGRGSNTWLDTGAGECLLSTWSMNVPSAPQAITAPRVGLALFMAANSVWPSLEWSLKAPNDLFLRGHKIGGLLVESVSAGDSHRLLIGLGLNVLNHPRRFGEAEHLSKNLEGGSVEEGEWFQFLDELHREFGLLVPEILQPTLIANACQALAEALNANSARAFAVQQVTPQGDLLHAQGSVRWTDL